MLILQTLMCKCQIFNTTTTLVKSNAVNPYLTYNLVNPFDEFQWVVEQEAGELAALSFVEDLIQKCQEIIFEKHIESQVMPFAVQFAQDTMLQVIEVRLTYLI